MSYAVDHERFLRRSIALARQAVGHGNHPFGALLVDPAGRLVLEAENTVVTERDCTGHAETNLVRNASRELEPQLLAACTLYTSTEPCAMCAAAIFWAGLSRVVFGTSAEQLYEIVGPGEPALRLSSRELFERCGRRIEVIGPMLETEASAVHEEFWPRL